MYDVSKFRKCSTNYEQFVYDNFHQINYVAKNNWKVYIVITETVFKIHSLDVKMYVSLSNKLILTRIWFSVKVITFALCDMRVFLRFHKYSQNINNVRAINYKITITIVNHTISIVDSFGYGILVDTFDLPYFLIIICIY